MTKKRQRNNQIVIEKEIEVYNEMIPIETPTSTIRFPPFPPSISPTMETNELGKRRRFGKCYQSFTMSLTKPQIYQTMDTCFIKPIGCGFSTEMRTLSKDIIYLSSKYPKIPKLKLQKLLRDMIPNKPINGFIPCPDLKKIIKKLDKISKKK